MTTTTAPESQPFQAEVAELLHLMVHSVYSETDIFLRELISNASDACDKLRYEAIANAALLGPEERLAITIRPDEAASTLTIADNGIGLPAQAPLPWTLQERPDASPLLGIGLLAVRRLAEREGGSFELQSGASGTTAVVRLRAA